MTYKLEGFSEEIFRSRYSLTPEETWEEACKRVARQMASAETPEKITKYNNKFYEELVSNNFVCGGRIWYNSGRPNPQLLNCFVLSDQLDSKEGWGGLSREMIITSMTGGGCGIDFSDVRPRDAVISGQKGVAPGAVELMKLINNNGYPIRAGGSRRVALMFSLDIDHPDIMEFLDAKLEDGELTNANVSLRCKNTSKFIEAVKNNEDWELSWKGQYKSTIKARDLWDRIVTNAYNSAEPGFLNWEMVEGESNIYYIEKLATTNPCLSGDTLVYLADGRGNVPIQKLAEDGKDVDVFCLDDKGKPCVRVMRNPRITGYKQDIYKVTLDNGSTVRATYNHKLRLKDGIYKEIKDLKIGDSLHHLVKYDASIKDLYKKANSNSQDYKWINNGFSKTSAEHRLIAEHTYGKKIPRGCVVHHKDFNASNNAPSNLEVMTKIDHDKLHGELMKGNLNPMRRAKYEWSDEKWQSYRDNMSLATTGENNGRFNGTSNEQLREHAIKLTNDIGYRFSTKDWEKYAKINKIPIQFSGWRNNHLNGGITGLAKWSALKLGLDNVETDPRTLKRYVSMLDQGYDVDIVNDKLFFNKRCECCEQGFSTQRREVGLCSSKCVGTVATTKGKDKIAAKAHKRYAILRETLKEKQLKVYTDLKFKLQRVPLKKEWQNICKDKDISTEICRKSSPFISWQSLKDEAEDYNYKVVSIELDRVEDVYNGTVDDFHNFFIGGFESKTKNGKPKFGYINNLQCGEIALSPYDCCCLGHLVLPRFTKNDKVDWEMLGNTVRLGVRFLDNVLSVNNFPLPEMKAQSNKLRRIGLGTTGLADFMAMTGYRYGSEEGNKFVDKLYKFISKQAYEASVMLAVEKGAFPGCDPEKHVKSGFVKRLTPKLKNLIAEHGIRNCALLTQAPTGTVSLLSGNCSSGIEPMFSYAYKRTYWNGDKREEELVYHPLFVEFMKAQKDVSHFIASHDLTVKEHMDIQKTVQKHVDNAVSKTINMAEDYPKEDMSEMWLEYLPHLKGTTFYRTNSRQFIDEKTGEASAPPLVPLTLEDAIAHIEKDHNLAYDLILDENQTPDCPNGMCEL